MPAADRPVRARLVRVLAGAAVLVTVPLWAPPHHMSTPDGVFMVATPAPQGVAAVRVASLVLVVSIALAVPVVGRKAGEPAVRRLALLFAAPALTLSWVGWRTGGGGSYTVAMAGSLGQGPPHAFASPWMPVAAAQASLVALLWLLAILGTLDRRRNRPAEPAAPRATPP